MSEFSIGEIAIIQNQVGGYAYLNGMECVVTGPLELRKGYDIYTGKALFGLAYLIEVEGRELNAPPKDLRKKRPPQQYTGEMRIREMFNQSPVKQPEPAECV